MSPSGDACLDAVRESLSSFRESSDDTPLLVAVSGGPDSVALAHMLAELRRPMCIAHFDHMTRGGASAEDAAFVKALAQDLGAPFYETSRDIEAEAAESPMSFEEYAREARYAFLVETATEHGCATIATGHHLDDQAETVLMRVMRGTSPGGLGGIPAVSERDGVPIVRPMLELRHDDIMGYLKDRGHRYCHDETNLDVGFVRNRIRHDLMPKLRHEYNPRVREALVRLADGQRAEDEVVAALADEFLKQCAAEDGALSREAFRAGHRALQRRAVLTLAWAEGTEPDFDHVERAIRFIDEAAPGKYFDLGSGVRIHASTETAHIVPVDDETDTDEEIVLDVPGQTAAFGRLFSVRELDGPPTEPLTAYCTPARQVFDASALSGDVCVRRRRNGDRLSPYGLGGTRKLKDYFSDLGIPPHERDRKLLVATDDDVLWVVGHAVSSKAVVTEATESLVQIEVLDEAR